MDARGEWTRAERRALFEDAARIVETEFDRSTTLDAVARRIPTSRRQLQRAFAEMGDTSFSAYLAEVRLTRAAALLRRDRAPVAEIARRVGYRSPSAFHVAFRRRYGVSPDEFRRSDRGRASG